MVNEIGDKLEDKKDENEQRTIRLGKYVTYNPSPFKSKDDFIIKTVVCIFFVALGIVMLFVPDLPVHIGPAV